MRWFIFPALSALHESIGIWFLTCIVVNMCVSYKRKKPRKSFKALVFSYSQAAAKQSSMTWSPQDSCSKLELPSEASPCVCFCCRRWKVSCEGVREFQEDKECAPLRQLNLTLCLCEYQPSFTGPFFPTLYFSPTVFEILGPGPLRPAAVVSYAQSNLYYRAT